MTGVNEVAVYAGVFLFFTLCAIWLPWLDRRHRLKKQRGRLGVGQAHVKSNQLGTIHKYPLPYWKRACDLSLQKSQQRRRRTGDRGDR